MTLHVYKLSDNCEAKSWYDVDYERDGEVVATIAGDTNAACEAAAANANYDDMDIYAWGYEAFEDLPVATDVVYIIAK